MKAVVRGLLTVLTVVVSLGLAGVTPAVAQEDIVSCVPTIWQLTAGQTIPVGGVVVNNDGENITVTYRLSNERLFRDFASMGGHQSGRCAEE